MTATVIAWDACRTERKRLDVRGNREMTARELQGFVGTAPEAHYRHFRLAKGLTAIAANPGTRRVPHGLIALGLSIVLLAPLAATAAGLNDTG